MFTTAHHLFLSSARLFQSAPSNPVALISIVILSSHLHLGLPVGLFPSRYPLYAYVFSPLRATYPTFVIILDLITQSYRVSHRSLRDFRPLRYSSRDDHAEEEHVNRGRDIPSFCPTLQVLDISILGDAADVNPVIRFLPHMLHVCGRHQGWTYRAPVR